MTFLFIFIVLEVIFYYINYDAHRHFFIFIISVFATYFIAFLSVVHVRKLSVDYLAINSTEYAALLTTFGRDWEFHRYLLFRHKLQHWKFRVEDVDEVRPLLDIEQQTLGSYVAQKPLTVWTYTTLGAILAASASNWPLKNVVVVTALGVFVLFILHISPMFITNQRRQYELRRFLAWYQADSLKLTATDFNRATPPPD